MICVLCDEKDAVFQVSTTRYEKQGGGVIRKNSGGSICPSCLLGHLTAHPNAHHFIYRIDAPYQPDGFNYDDGLVLAVLECAKYRRKTATEFMARAEQLVEWYGDVRDLL